MIIFWLITISCGDENFIEEMIADVDTNHGLFSKRLEMLQKEIANVSSRLKNLNNVVSVKQDTCAVNRNNVEQSKKNNKSALLSDSSSDKKSSGKKIKIDKHKLEKIRCELLEADKYAHEFTSIQGSVRILNIISRNLDILKKNADSKELIGGIKGILIYKKDDEYKDYWDKLKFKKVGDKYIDDTGFFEGILCKTYQQIADEGNITPIGFFQSNKLTRGQLGAQFTSIKILIDEIAREKKKNIRELMDENGDMSVVDKLIFAYAYKKIYNDETKFKDDVKVCICNDTFCINPCKEFRWVHKSNLI